MNLPEDIKAVVGAAIDWNFEISKNVDSGALTRYELNLSNALFELSEESLLQFWQTFHIQRGLDDANAGLLISSDEAKAELSKLIELEE